MRHQLRLERLATTAFTYPEIGGTRGPFPVGYHHLDCRRVVGHGDADFRSASVALMTWEVHRRAGLRAWADSPDVGTDVNAVLGIGIGPLRLLAPVRVVYTIEEPDRSGFAYGTLPGHPDSGEECFIVERFADGRVELVIGAFSRSATWWSRLGGPVTRRVQRGITARYLRALAS